MNMLSNTTPFQLFPEPNRKLLASDEYPKTWAGVTPSSTAALRSILEDNHKRWHVFYNDTGFHNHSAHTVLALWSLGAHESILEATYKIISAIQRPAFTSPSVIDERNWKEHLGDENYYNAYLKFFMNQVETKGAAASLEEYVFSANANVERSGKGQPAMLSRFIDGLFHPFIHTGYGFEFGLPGMVAEGLAWTAVHGTKALSSSFCGSDTKAVSGKSKKPVHALSILARILADSRFEAGEYVDILEVYETVHDKYAAVIKEYAEEWTLDGPIEKKVEELRWMNIVIYGIGGYQHGKAFNADFFFLHLSTSSLFLSSIIPQLSRPSQEALLRAYFANSLVWYIGRGRPAINIRDFYEKTSLIPNAPGMKPSRNESALPSPTSQYSHTPNPWFPILQSTLSHPDDHLVKLQRTLSYYASVYGTKTPGYLGETELKDAGMLDGTLFIRTSILTAGKIGWVREGEAPVDFDRVGFYRTSMPKAKL